MRGISNITDSNNRKKTVVIDLKAMEDHEEEVYEFLGVLIAESRKNDELISWNDANKQLKKKTKL